MKKKIKLIKTEKKEVEVEVEFPIYRQHCLDTCIIYTRIDPDLRVVKITIPLVRDGEYQVEIEDKYRFDHSEIDYHLGQGMYESSKKEFKEALVKLKTVVNSI